MQRRSRGKPECHKRVAERSGEISSDQEQYAQVQEKWKRKVQKEEGGVQGKQSAIGRQEN